ncbi:Lysine 2,3-aminomutase [Desulfurella amilsii]|uniref:Lysine 2,3-aminomutase n=1 Tax=Desulfurella amilsii TaxID=1562698 RepID=A0A1X4XWD3_9BACT|nr:KamA family radical SAM protein [Desulfurella amilsii]OSS41849.1 Lysine 2,3-aminomutase [Desulfurella amilsii]
MDFKDWHWQKRNSLKDVSSLGLNFVSTNDTLVTPYLLSLFQSDKIIKQFVETSKTDNAGLDDPLFEKEFTKSEGLIHRYPDRALLVVTNKCFANCRFCFRKSNWQNYDGFSLRKTIEYLNNHKEIREILISGGDPLTFEDESLASLIKAIKAIKHIALIRIATRALSVLPYRITNSFLEAIKPYKPIWFSIHINHPNEITKDFIEASNKIIDSGFPIVSQTVLLRDINNNTQTLKELFCKLVELRIKPYYLFGCDRAIGNERFRVKLEEALNIMESLRNNISGLCMPFFAFDVDDGGKVVLEPNRIVSKQGSIYKLKNFEGKEYIYEDAQY